jgi:hypothetical protein
MCWWVGFFSVVGGWVGGGARAPLLAWLARSVALCEHHHLDTPFDGHRYLATLTQRRVDELKVLKHFPFSLKLPRL